MDRITSIKDNMPSFYCVEDTDNHKSVLGAIITAIGNYIADTDKRIDRIDAMLGISTTYGEDLDMRWGNMLNMPRKFGEDDEIYRNRLKLASAGEDNATTKQAIIDAIAVVLGIENDEIAKSQQIYVDDAWEYEGPYDVTRDYGYIVCTVLYKSDMKDKYKDIHEAIKDAIINTKAGGVIAQLIFGNATPKTYRKLGDYTYIELGQDQYGSIGGVDISVII